MEKPPEATEPIFFNGERLPLGVYWMELLVPILEDLPKPIESWLLDLHYCGGVIREENSSTISQYCTNLNIRIREQKALIIKELNDRLPEINSTEMIRDWELALGQMNKLAGQSNTCMWTRRSFVNKEKAKEILDYLENNNPNFEN